MIADQVNFCPRCGTALVTEDRFGRLRPTCPACRWIYFPDPKVAVAALVCDQGKVLFVRRINEPKRGLWTLPAGFVDAGEDPAAAAERECREETGLNVRTTSLLDVIAGQVHSRGADILIVYQAEKNSGTLQPGDDADRAQFFDPGDLPPLAFTSTQTILDSWQENKK
jgi:8-oxo-dGTP diphosphatase